MWSLLTNKIVKEKLPPYYLSYQVGLLKHVSLLLFTTVCTYTDPGSNIPCIKWMVEDKLCIICLFKSSK